MDARIAIPYYHAALDLLFPRLCSVCDRPLQPAEAGTVCTCCWQDAEDVIPPFCHTCGQPLLDPPGDQPRCVACPQGHVYFDKAWSGAAYRGPVVRAVCDFKFRYIRANAQPLGAILTGAFRQYCAHLPVDALVPVPLHPAREREREFNQSELLALELARATYLPDPLPLLLRTRNTRPQSSLRGAARLRNIHAAFAVRPEISVEDETILLIDDVYTSGNTVNECARALKQAGAAAVFVLTAARTLS